MKKAGLRSVEKNAGSPEMQNDSFQLPEDFREGGGGSAINKVQMVAMRD